MCFQSQACSVFPVIEIVPLKHSISSFPTLKSVAIILLLYLLENHLEGPEGRAPAWAHMLPMCKDLDSNPQSLPAGVGGGASQAVKQWCSHFSTSYSLSLFSFLLSYQIKIVSLKITKNHLKMDSIFGILWWFGGVYKVVYNHWQAIKHQGLCTSDPTHKFLF